MWMMEVNHGGCMIIILIIRIGYPQHLKTLVAVRMPLGLHSRSPNSVSSKSFQLIFPTTNESHILIKKAQAPFILVIQQNILLLVKRNFKPLLIGQIIGGRDNDSYQTVVIYDPCSVNLINYQLTAMPLQSPIGGSPPQSYLLAMRALQIENEELRSLIMNSERARSEEEERVENSLKAALMDCKKELLDQEMVVNKLLREIRRLEEDLEGYVERERRYEVVIDQLERDKENIRDRITSKILSETRSASKATLSTMNTNRGEYESKENLQTYQNRVQQKQHSILPCILSLKTPSKPPNRSLLQQSTVSNTKPHLTPIKFPPSNQTSANNQYFKLLAKLRVEKQKLLVIVQHQIRRVERKMKSCGEDERAGLEAERGLKEEEKGRLEKEIRLLEME